MNKNYYIRYFWIKLTTTDNLETPFILYPTDFKLTPADFKPTDFTLTLELY